MHKVILTVTCGASTLKSTGSMVLTCDHSFTSCETYGPPRYTTPTPLPPNAWEHFPISVSAYVVPFVLHTHSIPGHLSWQKLTCPLGTTPNAALPMKVFPNPSS